MIPAGTVAGTPLYLKFWTKMVAVGVIPPPLELDEFEHEVTTEATMNTPNAAAVSFQPR